VPGVGVEVLLIVGARALVDGALLGAREVRRVVAVREVEGQTRGLGTQN
jgi:hypothetical protein